MAHKRFTILLQVAEPSTELMTTMCALAKKGVFPYTAKTTNKVCVEVPSLERAPCDPLHPVEVSAEVVEDQVLQSPHTRPLAYPLATIDAKVTHPF